MTTRLALAFVAVALTAIGLLAALTLWSARGSVEDLVQAQRAPATAGITAALSEAHQRARGWTDADLRPATALAAAAGARLQVRDAEGGLVDDPVLAMQQRMGQMHHGMGGPGPVIKSPVLVAGRQVGAVELRFPAQAPPAVAGVRDALVRTVAGGAMLGVGVALGVAILIARRITGRGAHRRCPPAQPWGPRRPRRLGRWLRRARRARRDVRPDGRCPAAGGRAAPGAASAMWHTSSAHR